MSFDSQNNLNNNAEDTSGEETSSKTDAEEEKNSEVSQDQQSDNILNNNASTEKSVKKAPSNALNALADEPASTSEEVCVYLNGTSIKLTTPGVIGPSDNVPTIYYGDDIAFELKGVDNLFSLEIYTHKNNIPLSENSWMSPWNNGTDKWDIKPSDDITGYYVSYDYTTEGGSNGDADFSGAYGFKVAKGTFSNPVLTWDGTKATWAAVTTTTTNGGVADGSITYNLNLYKNGSTTPVFTQNNVTGTSLELASHIGTYGKYYYTLQAVPTTDYNNLYNSSEVVTSGEYDRPDVTAPTVESFVGSDGVLTGITSDTESGVQYYAISSKADRNSLTTDEWSTVSNGPVISPNKATVKYTLKDDDHGLFYLHVKDADGNATTYDSSLTATHILFKNNYDSINKLHDKNSFVVGDTISFVADPVRPGYIFGGWTDTEGNAVTPSNITPGTSVCLTAKWTRSDINIVSPTGFDVTYDGETRYLTASVNSDVEGDVTWKWYKNDDEVAMGTGTSTSIELVDCSDSGTYKAKATVILNDGETSEVSVVSNEAVVNISKKALNIQAADKTIEYGSEVPAESFYTYSTDGLVEKDKDILVGGFTSDYSVNTACGTYDIYVNTNNPFVADNYNISTIKGTLTVEQKDATNNTNVVVSLKNNEDSSVNYNGNAFTPEVVVTDNGNEVSSSNYSVSYSNNINAGTATITVDFKNNYKGSKSIIFSIKKAIPTAGIVFEKSDANVTEWDYGTVVGYPGDNCDIQVKTNTNSDSTGRKYHFVKEDGTELAVNEIPTEPGNYEVYVVLDGTDNYESFSTVDSKVSFTINKRPLHVLITGGYTCAFDGDPHVFNNTYELVDDTSFAPGEGLNSIKIDGEITDVGEVQGTFVPVPLSGTDLDNHYELTVIDDSEQKRDRIIVTPQKLLPIEGLKWSKEVNAIGTAEWTARSLSDMISVYTVSLYRVSDTEDVLVTSITTDAATYDFKDIIKNDINNLNAASDEKSAYDYYFTVSVSPKNNPNYEASDVSSGKTNAVMHSALVYPKAGEGISNISMGQNTYGYVVMLQGETVNISIDVKDGYSDIYSWSDHGEISIASPKSKTTTVTLKDDIDSSHKNVTFNTKAIDDSPIIEVFTGETDNDKSEVYIGITASDSKDLTKWLITDSDFEPDKDYTGWNVITESELIEEEGRVKLSYDITKTQVAGEGTYYAYVMDSSENITKSEPLKVYKLDFSKGGKSDQTISGEMKSIYKVDDVPVVLPSNKYTSPGYAFVNWNTSSSTYNDKDTYTVNSSDTLVAQWTDRLYDYTVEYYIQDVNGEYPEAATKSAAFKSAYGATVGPEKEEILLDDEGFEVDKTQSETKTINDDNIVVKLYYIRQQYKLKYVLTDTSGTKSETETDVYYGAEITEREKTEIPGYSFVGWTYSDTGTKPETMPAHNVTATGYYRANKGKYIINYYFQNIDTDTGYTLRSTEEVESSQGTIIDTSSNVNEYEGFTLKGHHSFISNGAKIETLTVTDSNFEAYAQESDLAVSAVDGQILSINYYFNRNIYNLTLNVWTDESRTTSVYTRVWKLKYGTSINEDTYINDGKNSWDTKASEQYSIDTNKYQVSDIASWSTGLVAPTCMPAGDVTISRQYIPVFKDKYNVKVYLQNADGSYGDPYDTYKYEGAVGQTVTVGDGENYDVDVNHFEYYTQYFDICYSLDTDKSETSGIVKDSTEGDMLTLKLYMKRKEITNTITYVYVDKNGTKTEFASYTETGLWSVTSESATINTFTYNPLLYFYNEQTPSEKATSALIEGKTINGTSPISYDFNAKNCAVSVAEVWNYGWDTKTYKSYPGESESAFFGTPKGYDGYDNGSNVYVYYTELDADPTFVFDFYMDRTTVQSHLIDGEDVKVPITWTDPSTDKVYRLREANLSYLESGSFTEGTDQEKYHASKILNRTYSASEESVYEKKDINGRTYYLTKEADVSGNLYIYIPNSSNTYYSGRYCYASYDSNVETDIPFVKKWLTQYIERQTDSSDSKYDPKAAALYIYNRSNTLINYEDSNGNLQNKEVVVNFKYGTTYNLVLNLVNTAGVTSNKRIPYVKGSTITYENIAKNILDQNYQALDGYEIKWYLDKDFNEPLETTTSFVNIKADQYLYGRYEKTSIKHHLYAHYQTRDGKYLSLGDIVDITSGTPTLKDGYQILSTENKSETYINEEGKECTLEVTTTNYGTTAGDPVLSDVEIPGVSFTENKLTNDKINQYKLEHFYYDEANEANKTYAYCEYAPVQFQVYYARNKHTLKIDNDYDKDNVVNSYIKKYGEKVTVKDPVKPGYKFNGWEFKKIVTGTDSEGNPTETYADPSSQIVISDPVEDSDTGEITRSFIMPDEDILIKAKWLEDDFDSVIRHYFQTGNKNYVTGLDEAISGLIPETVSTNYGSGEKYSTGIVVIRNYSDKYDLYFKTDNAVIDGTIYTLEPSDLVMATNKVTLTSKKKYNVSDNVFSVSGTDFNMFTFAFLNYTDTLEGKSSKKDGVTKTETEDQTIFEAVYGNQLDNYYTRTSDLKVRLAAFSSDGNAENGLTLSGDGSYLYGKKITISATLNKGYTFVGWFNAADVLKDYPAEGKELSDYELDSTKLKTATSVEFKTTVSPYQFDKKVKASADYVAVSKPEDIATPTVTITGKDKYTYGYANSSENKLNAKVTFDDGIDTSNYSIKDYEWYIVDESGDTPIADANSGVYNFETGKNAGTYTYKCKVTLEHIGNGRTIEVTSDPYTVTVNKADLTVDITNYSGYYDGYYHNIGVVVNGLVKDDKALVYYSTTELTAENYKTAGKLIPEAGGDFAGVKDVNSAADGTIISTPVYIYVVSADTTYSNYNDLTRSGNVTLQPKTVTIVANPTAKRFERLYDGTTVISGSVTTEGTDKYTIAHGGYITISGLTQADIDAGVSNDLLVDFDGNYNSKDVRSASKITLSDMCLVDGQGNQNFNYVIPKTLDIQGIINRVEVTLVWPTDTTFTYNAKKQVAEPTGVDVAEPSKTVLADEISKFAITVSGAETNVNNSGEYYTANAKVTIASPYLMSNYTIKETSHDFNIVPRTIYVKPDNDTLTYDGKEHGLDNFTLYESDQTTEYSLPTGFTTESYTYDNKYTNASEYTITATGIKIKDDLIDVSYNYDINYLSGTLTINKKVVTIDGIVAKDKNYDGTNNATLDLTNAKVSTPIDGEILNIVGENVVGAFAQVDQGTDIVVNITYKDSPISAGDNTDINNYSFDSSGSQKTSKADIKGCNIDINTTDVEGIYGEDLSSQFGFTYGYDYSGNQFVPNETDKIVTGNPTYKVIPSGDTAPIDYTTSLATGTYTIVVVTDNSSEKIVSGMECTNYTFVEGTKGTLTIKPRPIVIEENVDGYSKIEKEYDGNTAVKVTIKNSDTNIYYKFTNTSTGISGILNGDEVDIDTYTSAVYNSKDVPTATSITVSGIKLNNSNYVLMTADGTEENNTLLLTEAGINKKELTVKVSDKKITYGTQTPATSEYEVTLTGFVSGEGNTNLTTVPTVSSDYDSTDPKKRNVVDGGYVITPSGGEDENYSFNYEGGNGTLTVEKSVLAVVANDKGFTYSVGIDGNLPTWDGEVKTAGYQVGTKEYSGLKYDDTSDVLTGVPSYKCDSTSTDGIYTLPGKYSIVASEGTLKASMTIEGNEYSNYSFVYINGNLTINKKSIKVSGITINPKTYDGTTGVVSDKVVKPVVDTANYEGIAARDTSSGNIELTTSKMKYDSKDVGTDRKVSLTYADGETTKFAYELNDYLDNRYTLDETNSQKEIENAKITRAPLTIKADDIPVSPNVFHYGSSVPTYTATYTGLVNEETEDVLGGDISFSCDYTADATSYGAATTYTITPSGYEAEVSSGNYYITFETGTLTVTPDEFSKPVVKWSDTESGVITWTKPDDIGNVSVASFEITLYRADTATGEYTEVSGGKTTIQVSKLTPAQGVYTYNYHELLDDSKGVYKVQVKAVSGNEGNVKSSENDLSTADKTYSTLVTVIFNTDAASVAGGVSTTINNNATSYIMVAGDSDFPYTATLKGYKDTDNDGYEDCTGYDVASVATSNTNLSVTEGTKLGGKGTVYKGGKVSAGFDIATTDANVIVTLSKTAAFITPSLSFKDSTDTFKEITYGYTAADAPFIQEANTLGSGDTNMGLDLDDYEFSYKWSIKKNQATKPIEVEGATSNLLHFPTGMLFNRNGYIVICEVTATRRDNGESITVSVRKNNYVKVLKASYNPTVKMVGWKYGEARKSPSLTPEHPEKDDPNYKVTYYYRSERTGTYSTVIPKNAGTYYVKATVSETDNYNSYEMPDEKATEFTITKNQLAKPEGLLIASSSAPYGGIKWDEVLGPKENGGSSDSDSYITPKYEVKLYKEGTTEALTSATIDSTQERMISDWSAFMANQGKYYFTIQALSDNEDNCSHSDIFKSSVINIDRYVKHDRNDIYYDGNPITLSLEGTVPPEGSTYQWYKDGEAITGASSDTYKVTNVNETGKYSCVVTSGGTANEYSTIDVIKIKKRPIKIMTDDGTKTYDGTPLTKNVVDGDSKNYKIEYTGAAAQGAYTCNTPLVDGDSYGIEITGTQTAAGKSNNSIKLSINRGETSLLTAKSFSSDTSFDDLANYIITVDLGELSVTKKAVTVKAEDKEKTYGAADPVFTYTASGLVDNETLIGIIFSRVNGEDIGVYPITATAKETDNPNYDITFETGDLTINPKPVKVKPESKSKIYGDTDPALTYTVDPASLPFEDKITVVLARETGEDVGQYAINETSHIIKDKSGNDVTANYSVTYDNEGVSFSIGRKG
ncbi:MAG: InlB B-repeat-containing protein, partial [Eubacterium sp.]|nr:InlB B-repeat-containing protein [Eubacterium sp.]